jgi:hypothetical protein
MMNLFAPIIAADERLSRLHLTQTARLLGMRWLFRPVTSPPYVVGVTGHVESGAARWRRAVIIRRLGQLLFEA